MLPDLHRGIAPEQKLNRPARPERLGSERLVAQFERDGGGNCSMLDRFGEALVESVQARGDAFVCDGEDLGVRYGAIGISAVAAAVRYAGDGKNQAYAPVVHRVEKRFTEAAAS